MGAEKGWGLDGWRKGAAREAMGGKWIFIGMESVDPVNLKDVNKGFNKPDDFTQNHLVMSVMGIFQQLRLIPFLQHKDRG